MSDEVRISSMSRFLIVRYNQLRRIGHAAVARHAGLAGILPAHFEVCSAHLVD